MALVLILTICFNVANVLSIQVNMSISILVLMLGWMRFIMVIGSLHNTHNMNTI